MRALRVPGLLVLAAGLACIGWLLMSTNFMVHDDEGYVLLSLRDFAEHGGLYDRVFTQYGPAPFLYYEGLHRLFSWPITNLLGRSMTMVHWIGAAFAAGLIAWRLSGRYWTALFTLVAVFGYLWQMTWEPPHPGGLISLVTAVGLAAAIEALWRSRAGLAVCLLGLAGAVLLLTKINVGLLWCCSVGAFLLLSTDTPFLRKHGVWLAATGLTLLPFVLMQPLLGETTVRSFAVMSSLSGLAVCFLMAPAAVPAIRVRHWAAGLGGFLGLSAVLLGAILAQGTTPHGLLKGVLLDPLRHPGHFHFGFPWPPVAWVILGVALMLTALWRWRPPLRPQLILGVAWFRLLVLGIFVWQAKSWLTVYGTSAVISCVLPLAPIFLLPLNGTPAGDRGRTGALLLALVGMGQVLHAYPVAGSQMAWGSFLLVPLFVAGLAEAATLVADRLRRPWLGAVVAVVALAAAGQQAYLLAQEGRQRWLSSDPLELAGAETIRPPENILYALRILTANVELHAHLLYSRPGMFSFNLWSGVPTPTLRNATHWFWLLSPEEQLDIVARLRAEPRTVIISSRPLVDILARQMSLTITGPLNDYIRENYRQLFTVTGYDFLVPRTSHAVPFYVARNFQLAPGASGSEPAMITVNVASQATVARIVLRDVRDPARILAEWHEGNSRVTLALINTQGLVGGTPQACPWPLRIDGLRQLRLYHHLPMTRERTEQELVFFDAAGRRLFEACYQDQVSDDAPPAGG